MSSITWSMPATSGVGTLTDNRYWQTSTTAITATVTHTPALIVPAVTYQRKISIFLPQSLSSTAIIAVRLWVAPPADFLNTDAIEGHHWMYGGQNLADYICSDEIHMACLEPADTIKVIVKVATLVE